MASPRPFYPLQQPVFQDSLPSPVRSALVVRQPRARMEPAVVSAPAVRVSISISPSPTRSAELPRFLHMTFLPDREESVLSGRARLVSSIPRLRDVALPDAPHCRMANRAGRSLRSASLHHSLQIRPHQPVR